MFTVHCSHILLMYSNCTASIEMNFNVYTSSLDIVHYEFCKPDFGLICNAEASLNITTVNNLGLINNIYIYIIKSNLSYISL